MAKTNNSKKYFLGIDLGGKNKKTSGICILEKDKEKIFCNFCEVIFGKDILKNIDSYLKNTKVIAIDAPLTKGRGKGKMRLYEKFLSTKIFRKEKTNPIPPALMPDFCKFARDLVKELKKKGFVLDLNLIEVFPTLTEKIINEKFFSETIYKKPNFCKTENKNSALICAILAFFHFQFKTRYLGYKDGFLFLPEFSFWRKKWQEKFLKAWKEKSHFKYKHLTTNIFKEYEKRRSIKNFK